MLGRSANSDLSARRWHPLAIVAAFSLAGAALTFTVGIATLTDTELEHLAWYMPPAIVATLAVTAAAINYLTRSSVRVRLVGIAAFAALVGAANIGVLAWLMLVSEHDALQILLMLLYSTAAAVGVALALARGSAEAVERVSAAARRIAEGDLDTRVGRLEAAGPELDALASTVDEMAGRLRASIERERAIEEQRRDLVTAVSHDLRTPLSGIRAMVEAIDDEVVTDEETIRRYVREMRSSMDSLVALVDDLFELVQLDAGAIEAETQRARLGDVVRSAVAACDAQATEKGLLLETRLDGAEGALTSPRLTRVVQNLLQNAIRHTPADGTVRVEARRDRSVLELVVEDTGEGIDEAALGRVFDPFWRGDAARSSAGSGLGLALAKRIVEALGGSIVVQSEPARGSRFAVVLPDRSALPDS
jgi:signal transduction histidine kinase